MDKHKKETRPDVAASERVEAEMANGKYLILLFIIAQTKPMVKQKGVGGYGYF